MRLEKITIIGSLGGNARHTIKDENNFCSFNVATVEEYEDKFGQTKKRGHWYNCILNKPTEKQLERLTKGSLIYIEGVPKYSVYKSENGNYEAQVSISVNSFRFLSKAVSNEDDETKPFAKKIENPFEKESIPEVAGAANLSEGGTDMPF